MNIDVFNGDADGICALHQLRMAHPLESELVTGVKRDIKLLARLNEVHDSHVTVLDISMDSNKEALLGLLNRGNSVQYFDHHFAGEIPQIAALEAHVDTAPDVCTSVLVDRFLEGQFQPWAIAAAFGDNLHKTANQMSESLSAEKTAQLCELGELINYNGYGQEISDLHFAPADLYLAIQPFQDPWEFYHDSEALPRLKSGFKEDMENAKAQKTLQRDEVGVVHAFPAQAWCKRVAGVFSNANARDEPTQAHALLVDNGDGTHLVSVRAPLERPQGADELCRSFATGGGRAAAAGINQLPESEVEHFLERFSEIFA